MVGYIKGFWNGFVSGIKLYVVDSYEVILKIFKYREVLLVSCIWDRLKFNYVCL